MKNKESANDNQLQDIKPFWPKAIQTSNLMVKLAFGGLMTVGIFWYIIPAFYMLFQGAPFVAMSPYFFLFGISLVGAAFYFGYLKSRLRISIVILLGIGYLIIDTIWNNYIDTFAHINPFPGITIASTIISIVIVFCGVIGGLIYFFLETVRRYKEKATFRMRKQKREKNQSGEAEKTKPNNLGSSKKKKVLRMILLLGVLLASFFTYALDSNLVQIKEGITVEPGEEQVELAFWDPIDPNRYTTLQKEELNEYNVTIIAYDLFRLPVNFTQAQFEYQKNYYIDSCKYWLHNYPNVNIMPAIIGMPGTFQWDGNADYSIWLTKEIINMTLEENLDNVIGLNTDQEYPAKNDFEEYPKVNRTRNQEATEQWQDFMAEFYEKHGDRFEFQTTFSMDSIVDVLDGDNDLDIIRMNNVLDVNYTEYGPMIYTAGGDAIPTYERYNVNEPHSELYLNMQVLNRCLYEAGHGGKIGIYLGITGKSFMSNRTENILDGDSVGYGFEGLVMQAKIAKHFGCERISTFVLQSLRNSDGSYQFVGAYEAYGDDFISRYWDAINGDDVEGFEFNLYYLHNIGEDLRQDLLFGNIMYILILAGFFTIEGLILSKWKKAKKSQQQTLTTLNGKK